MDAAWLWIGFTLFVVFLLAFDLGVFHRRAREVSVRRALWLSAAYIGLALLFNAGILWLAGPQRALEFLTGYLIEKSLSLDNIFVISLIFAQFAVPGAYRHRVLFWGVLDALAMRGVLIYAGFELVSAFHWIFYVFGAVLVAAGAKMLIVRDAAGGHPDPALHPVVRFARSRLRMTGSYDGRRFVVRRGGLLYATPLLLVLVLVEISDLVFAAESIPVILAISDDPFIIYTSNVFAILGLRALYFALEGVVPRFVYLKHGIALALVAIGLKMLVSDFWKVPTAVALAVTLALIGGSILLSLLRPPRPVPAE